MATSTPTEFLVGCDPVVRIQIIEDDGNLVILANSVDGTADIDGLFFNLANETVAPDLTIFPEVDTRDIVDFTVQPNTLNQLNNGAQVQDLFDVRVEFGVMPFTTEGTVNEGGFTLYLDAGVPLTADDIDTTNFTVVVNSDGGAGGIALTNTAGAPTQTVLETVTAFSEDFNGIHYAEQSANVVGHTDWDIVHGRLNTDGNDDGQITFAAAASEGPVTFSFDAFATCLHNFEATGHYADSLELQVNIGGVWTTLDTFVINGHKTALVGSETGQTITAHSSTLSYEGGILADVQGDVQFRFVSDISSHDEDIYIDNVQMTVTEEVDPNAYQGAETLGEENFDSVYWADQSALIDRDDYWQVSHDQLVTHGHADGVLQTTTLAASEPVTISINAEVDNLHVFEAGGHYGDSLTMQVRVDGGHWTTVDVFEVNGDKSALVGSLTGQTITEDNGQLTYDGGLLADVSSSVQFRMISDISAGDEVIRFDNLQIVSGGETMTTEGFDGAAGDTVSTQFDGVSISAQKAGDAPGSANDAMLFDTNHPTGGDHDLEYNDQGTVIIISEDGDAHDPDDNAHGGTISFDFEAISDVQSINVLDIEERGGTIDLFDQSGDLIETIAIPTTADNGIATVQIGVGGVSSMDVNLTGSGAVDDLVFQASGSGDDGDTADDCFQYDVTYDDGDKDPDETIVDVM